MSLRARPGRVSSSLNVSVRGVSSDAIHALNLMQDHKTFASDTVVYLFTTSLLLGPPSFGVI